MGRQSVEDKIGLILGGNRYQISLRSSRKGEGLNTRQRLSNNVFIAILEKQSYISLMENNQNMQIVPREKMGFLRL